MPEKTEKQPELNQPVTLGDVLSVIGKMQEAQDARFLKMLEEMKKPSAIEQKELDKQQKALEERQRERKENAAEELKAIQLQHQKQKNCLHKRRDGSSRAVYDHAGFFTCQECQAVIFPEPAPPEGKQVPNAFYDSRMFNELRQLARRTDL